MDDQEIEKEIQAKGLNAPRVTLEHIESRIMLECYTTGDHIPVETHRLTNTEDNKRSLDSLSCLTVCVLVLRNGFTVVGTSACASPENFNAELGRKIARQHAVDQIWGLEGYLLKEKLNAQW